jgi:cobalt-zinc-cadmium efflux system membrane fusion protein
MKTHSLMIVSSLIFIGCNSTDPEEKETKDQHLETVQLTDEQAGIAGIEVASPIPRVVTNEIMLYGYMEAPPGNLISISAPYGGYVKSTPLLQGMHLHKGDIIAIVEHQDYINIQEDYLETENQLRLAQADLSRQEQLVSGEASSEKKLQEARSALQGLVIKKGALREKLEFCGIDADKLRADNISRSITLYSPVNAFVKAVNANRGKYIDSKEVIAELVDTDHLHVELKAYEKDLRFIHEGAPIRFTTAGNSSKVNHAYVHLVGKSIGDDRSITIHGHLDEHSETYTPGESVTAYITPQSDSSLSVQSQAVFSQNGHEYVFVETKKGMFKLVEVKISGTNGEFTAITSDQIDEGSKVVIKGLMSLRGMLFNSEEEHSH